MPRKKCSKSKVKIAKSCKQITLPVEWELYKNIVNDKEAFHLHAKVSDVYQSPAHRLNGRIYHDNWSRNLLTSTSLVGANC